MIATHDTFADGYLAGLQELLDSGECVPGTRDPTSVGSEFGLATRDTLELRPYCFQIRNPLACLVSNAVRQPDLAYAIGQWLWVMRGSDRLDEIAYFNARGRLFSDDGRRLAGAFGTRMRGREGNQLAAAVQRLREDPTGRRAFVAIASHQDILSKSRDFPCAIGLQFLIRNETLEAMTIMRSQSALMVFPYDAAQFMLTHAWLAAQLEVPVGPHTWLAHSFHLYRDELAGM